MALTKFGGKSKTIYLNDVEAHKLHLEFEVGAAVTVKKGQPVVLNSDGTIRPVNAALGADAAAIIGYSIHNGEVGELVTVGMRAFAVVYAEAGAVNQNAGIVFATNVAPTDPDMVRWVSAAAGTMHGWALDQSVAVGDIIRVAVI
jgi:hypothetical protein